MSPSPLHIALRKLNDTRYRHGTATAGLIAAMALSACHTTPPQNAALAEAHKLYNEASSSPDVARGAKVELDRAHAALMRADEDWAERRDARITSHQAYLATQLSQVAINVGIQRAADSMVTAAGVERERIRADATAQVAQAQVQSAQASAESAESRAQSLAKELAELSGKQTAQGLVVVLQDVLFDVGQSTLREGARAKLDKLAAILSHYPERHVLVQGFTDSTGKSDLNQTLSERRAEAVRDALIGMGVQTDRIETRGYGQSRPVASNKTAAGRQQNRRVEVVFSDAQGKFAAP